MAIGSNWTVLNVGIRFRQSRIGVWTSPAAIANRIIGFGICHGTSAPYGSATSDHFVGVSTGSSWARLSANRHWWETGYEMFSAVNGSNTSHETGSTGTVRVSADDGLVSAWYLRFTKLNAGSVQLDLFVPSSAAAVTPFEFAMQIERQEWNRCVSSHESYRQFTVTASISETDNGTLDSVNIFSNLETADTEQLGPVEWLEVKAVRIE